MKDWREAVGRMQEKIEDLSCELNELVNVLEDTVDELFDENLSLGDRVSDLEEELEKTRKKVPPPVHVHAD